jgi:sugar O-acyltransferase (sialic acid O-acetyltransferase NeuD family)
MDKLVLIGGGGHCKSCIDVIELEARFEILGVLDLADKLGNSVLGHEIKYTDDHLKELVDSGVHFLNTTGQIKDPSLRVKYFETISQLGGKFACVISPRAHVAKNAKVGAGTIVMHDALVNADASVGENCIINTKALIEHDAVIADHVHIATGAIVNGGTKVGARTFIGSGAVTKEYIEVGSDLVIPASKFVK